MKHPHEPAQQDVTYYTVSDHDFFLGTVMLVNSLRLTGNHANVVVLDAGLTDEQRVLLQDHVDIVKPPPSERSPATLKPYPHRLDPSGTVVVIDSDIVVTAPLDELLDLARGGKIVATRAWTEAARERWFPEWEETFQLRAPLRRQEWFHNGLVVLSIDHWPYLLRRWAELTDLAPPEQAFRDEQPFNAPDADALNALLMSEIERDALALLPLGDEAFGGDVVIDDVRALRCTLKGAPTRFLHYPDSPKPWQRRGWVRVGVPAYGRIMRRLLFEPDLSICIDPSITPLWLRTGPSGRAARAAAAAANWMVVGTSQLLPEPARMRLRVWRRRAFGQRPESGVASKPV
jgi:hypothetical protein